MRTKATVKGSSGPRRKWRLRMKKPVLLKANAEELGHSGISPIRRPPEDSGTLCHMPQNSELAATVAESCPHKGACPWGCRMDTQLCGQNVDKEGLSYP